MTRATGNVRCPPALPRTARVLDVVTLLLIALSASLVFTGGFRTEILDVRLSVTSWFRPIVLALVLTGVRHALWRAPAMPPWFLAAARAWATAPETRAALPAFVATRLGVLLVGLLAVFAIGYPMAGGAPLRLYQNELANLPVRWDAGWYYGIAMDGYRFNPDLIDTQQNIAFFPAYPMLMRYTSIFVGRETIWAGMLIALGSFFWALVYLYRLARTSMDEDRAAAAVTLLAVYPFAVFYSAPYTESLFLLSMVAAWFHYQGNRLWPAALWGLLAGLTRPNGCFLSVPLGLMAVAPLWRDGRLRRPPDGWASIADRLAVAAMPGIGLLLYSAFVYNLTGDPLQWAKLHAAWGRTFVGLDDLVANEAEQIGEVGIYGIAASRTPDLMNAAGVLFALATTWPVLRRFGLPSAVLILLTVLPPLANGGFMSMGRVTSVLFPCFLWLAAAVPVRHRTAWIAAFAILQGFVAVMFFTWRPMF